MNLVMFLMTRGRFVRTYSASARDRIYRLYRVIERCREEDCDSECDNNKVRLFKPRLKK